MKIVSPFEILYQHYYSTLENLLQSEHGGDYVKKLYAKNLLKKLVQTSIGS